MGKLGGYRLGGLTFLSRRSDGSLGLVCYCPASSSTWHWGVSVGRKRHSIRLYAKQPGPQSHTFIALPFGGEITISRQTFHLTGAKP